VQQGQSKDFGAAEECPKGTLQQHQQHLDLDAAELFSSTKTPQQHKDLDAAEESSKLDA
jgi:hypothetical protein